MATRPITTRDKSVQDVFPSDRSHTGPARINRYQLTVVASSLADVVRSAGGWLCDRARAGWDVNVLVADHRDARPLAILGTTALDAGTELPSLLRKASLGGALAVSAELMASDASVRAEVLRILKRGFTEVTVWGDDWPAELGRSVDPVSHRVSSAARAFKAHAVAAAAVSTNSITPTETLFYLGTESFRPLYSV